MWQASSSHCGILPSRKWSISIDQISKMVGIMSFIYRWISSSNLVERRQSLCAVSLCQVRGNISKWKNVGPCWLSVFSEQRWNGDERKGKTLWWWAQMREGGAERWKLRRGRIESLREVKLEKSFCIYRDHSSTLSPQIITHIHPYLQFQRIWGPLLTSTDMRLIWGAHTYMQAKHWCS